MDSGAAAIGFTYPESYSGSIFIEGGYITALGYDAPAIGDASSSTEPPREIKISGGVVYAKSNAADIPGIALGNAENKRPVYIMGGSVSADVQMPKNQFGDDLQVYARNFGAKHVGKSLSFTVDSQERYTYAFDVPDDGIAWIWAPSTAVVPEVAEATLTGSGSTGVNVLTVTASGAPSGYRWAYAPTLAQAQAGNFTLLTTTQEPTYTDLECQLGEQRVYTATALYDDGSYFNLSSDILSLTAGGADVTVTINAGEILLSGMILYAQVSGGTASEYDWYRAEMPAGPFTLLATTTVHNYTDKTVSGGKDYWYYVVARGTDANGYTFEKPSSVIWRTSKAKVVLSATYSWFLRHGALLTAEIEGREDAKEFVWKRTGPLSTINYQTVATTSEDYYYDAPLERGAAYTYQVIVEFENGDKIASNFADITIRDSDGGCLNIGFGVYSLFGAALLPFTLLRRKKK